MSPGAGAVPESANAAPDGKVLASVVAFGRVLRSGGLRVTSRQIADVARALGWVGVEDRDRVFRVCRALMVTRREELALFETLFGWFWSAREDAERTAPPRMPPAPRHRLRPPERFTIATYMAFKARESMPELDVHDRSGTYTDVELLRNKRFAEMTEEELTAVRRLLTDMEWTVSLRRTRRYRPHPMGRSIDLRRVLRQTGRLGSIPARLPRRRRTVRRRPVVVMADISGSMEKYSRLVLQFLHAMIASMPRVETFVFATRLSRITPYLRLRNPDRALDVTAGHVRDWAGGTRIAGSLRAFNKEWSRRVRSRRRRGARARDALPPAPVPQAHLAQSVSGTRALRAAHRRHGGSLAICGRLPSGP
jgi:uncharacterized protein with von Willebrand factor type A (vWA) domain